MAGCTERHQNNSQLEDVERLLGLMQHYQKASQRFICEISLNNYNFYPGVFKTFLFSCVVRHPNISNSALFFVKTFDWSALTVK